ncbi:hypothetical protein HPP92_018519 [Vanilla planifolia]|uniref:Uncharacterized protein n=1 Tax=Vanilla planifolia TaxID=51239 RepID=A0A835QA02_VANPL|nr:hypothetical protein HPP92_018519 [Vanilla planifolia]
METISNYKVDFSISKRKDVLDNKPREARQYSNKSQKKTKLRRQIDVEGIQVAVHYLGRVVFHYDTKNPNNPKTRKETKMSSKAWTKEVANHQPTIAKRWPESFREKTP